MPARFAAAPVDLSRLREPAITAALLVGMALVVAWAWAPALDAFLVRDDFAQVAYARLLGSPWGLFVHDHFIPAGTFFRPLGFALLWLTTVLAHGHVAVHYAVALGLHLLVSLALWSVLVKACTRRSLAGVLALLFAVAPAAVGTSLWLADRFDLLVALFALLALRLAWSYREHPRPVRLAALAACTMLAMLAKETGLLVVVPTTVLWLGWAGRRPRLRVSWRALLLLWAVPVLYLLWRMTVLGGIGGGERIAAQSPLLLLWQGGSAWLAHLPGYLLFWSRLVAWQQWALALAAVLLLVTWRPWAGGRRAAMTWLLCGLAMFLLPAAIQAPVAAISAVPLDADLSPLRVAMQSRLYYVALCGLVIALGALLSGVRRPVAHAGMLAGLAIVVLLDVASSHSLATAYSARSQAMQPLADAAVAAVEKLPLPAHPCQIYLLGTEQPPESGLYTPMDSVLKARMPDIDKIANCLIQTESAPFFHLLRRGTLAHEAIAPLAALPGHAPDQPLQTIGNLEIAALNLSASVDARQMTHAYFLAWQDGRFVNVTAAVRAGRRTVHFQCIRSPAQCGAATGAGQSL